MKNEQLIAVLERVQNFLADPVCADDSEEITLLRAEVSLILLAAQAGGLPEQHQGLNQYWPKCRAWQLSGMLYYWIIDDFGCPGGYALVQTFDGPIPAMRVILTGLTEAEAFTCLQKSKRRLKSDLPEPAPAPAPKGRPELLREACMELASVIHITGGIMTRSDGCKAPVGDPGWSDLAEVYLLACEALGYEPQYAPGSEPDPARPEPVPLRDVFPHPVPDKETK